LATPVMDKATKAAKHKNTVVLQQHPDVRPTRLAVVREMLVERGFSDTVAERMSARNRKSTTEVYQSRWNIYRIWCEHRDLDPLEASISEIADFLYDLYERGYQVGSKSAISSTLEHIGSHIGRNKDLTDLLQSLAISRPVQARKVPARDLYQVLGMLNGELFEPLSTVDIKYLAYKTAFLLSGTGFPVKDPESRGHTKSAGHSHSEVSV
jgi:hypothetical protein